jgi:chaperonin cofactor prefoldin
MPNNQLFLGSVEKVIDEGRARTALLRPRYQELHSRGRARWIEIHNQATVFPAEGLVIWKNAPADLVKGSVWQFEVEAQWNWTGNGHKYRTKAPPTAPLEVLELATKQHNPDEEEGDLGWVADLIRTGIRLKYVPSDTLVISVQGDTWLGPLKLIQTSNEDVWVANEKFVKNYVPVFSALPEQLDSVSIGGLRQLLAPHLRLPPPTGALDFGPASVILHQVLKWFLREHPAEAAAVRTTQQLIERAITLVESEGAGEDGILLRHRLSRARSALRRLSMGFESVDGLVQELAKLPAVARELDAARKDAGLAAIRRVRTVARRRMTNVVQSIERCENDLALLEEQKREVQSELDSLEGQLQRRQADVDEQVRQLEEAVVDRALEAVAEPVSLLSEVVLFRAFLGTPPKPKVRLPTPEWPVRPDVEELATFDSFRKQVRQHFRAAGLAVSVAPRLTAAFLSDTMPVLAGSMAFETLKTFASAAFGGNCLWLPVSPTFVEPGDLLGRWDPVGQDFAPHPSGLLELLDHASSTDDQYLVVLDGINLAAADSYLLPLLQCCLDGRVGPGGRTLPFTYKRPDGEVRRFVTWPSNVHVAGILSDASCSIRVSPSFWVSAALIDLDDSDESDSDRREAAGEEVVLRRVPPARWSEWKADGSSRTDGFETLRDALAGGDLHLPRGLIRSAERTFGARRVWSDATSDAMTAIVYTRLLPYCIASEQADELIKQLTGGTAASVSDAAARRVARLLG